MILDLTSISNFELLFTLGTCGEGTFIFFARFFLKGEVRLIWIGASKMEHPWNHHRKMWMELKEDFFTRQASAFLRKRWTGAGCGSVCCWLCGLSSWCAELLDRVRLKMSTKKTSWLDSMVSLFTLVGGRSTDLMVKHWINLLEKIVFKYNDLCMNICQKNLIFTITFYNAYYIILNRVT
jgi:hypothetical protein